MYHDLQITSRDRPRQSESIYTLYIYLTIFSVNVSIWYFYFLNYKPAFKVIILIVLVIWFQHAGFWRNGNSGIPTNLPPNI